MADEGNDTVAIVLGIAGATLVVGGFLYYAFKSPAAPPTATTGPSQAGTDAATPSTAPVTSSVPASTYAMSLSSDQNITLKEGETVLVTLPPPPAGTRWNPIVENHDGGVNYMPQNPGQDPNTFVVVATKAGVSVVRFCPADRYGPQGALYNLSVTVTP